MVESPAVLNMMLWYGGARAFAITGERVTATTTITASGRTILINGHRTVGPFHVIAIGDPRVMREVLEARGGFVDRMRRADIGVQVFQHRELSVPAYRAEGSDVRHRRRRDSTPAIGDPSRGWREQLASVP